MERALDWVAENGPALAFEVSYEPIYTVYLQYPDGVRLDRPMLGLDRGHVQWVFDRGWLAGEHGLIACVISAHGAHEALTHAALAECCARELGDAIPGLPAPRGSQVIAEKRATAACVPGAPRPDTRPALDGLYLAGDYTDPEYPPTLEAAVRSGLRAAQAVAEDRATARA